MCLKVVEPRYQLTEGMISQGRGPLATRGVRVQPRGHAGLEPFPVKKRRRCLQVDQPEQNLRHHGFSCDGNCEQPDENEAMWPTISPLHVGISQTWKATKVTQVWWIHWNLARINYMSWRCGWTLASASLTHTIHCSNTYGLLHGIPETIIDIKMQHISVWIWWCSKRLLPRITKERWTPMAPLHNWSCLERFQIDSNFEQTFGCAVEK